MAGTWAPYTGADAILLTVALVVVAAAFAYIGMKLEAPITPARPGKATSVLLVLIWVVSLLAFFVDSITYGWVLQQSNLLAIYKSYTAPNPVSPITDVSAVVTFIVIVLLTRKHGLKVSLLSAFAGAASAAMIFELPFDLIVLTRIYPSIPPAPNLFRLLFFLPLFLLELSTMSFLTFSPLTRLSRYTLFTLAGFFVVLAIWAAFGFSYPSNPLDAALNDISKVLCFVAAITIFIGDWVDLGKKTGQTDAPRSREEKRRALAIPRLSRDDLSRHEVILVRSISPVSGIGAPYREGLIIHTIAAWSGSKALGFLRHLYVTPSLFIARLIARLKK